MIQPERESAIPDRAMIVVVKKGGVSPLLTSLVVLLVMAAGLMFAYKKVARVRDWFGSHFRVEKIQNAADQGQESLLQKLERLEQDIKKNSRRIKILGITHNENFSAVSQQSKVRDLIMLDHDWKMSSEPRLLEIADEDMGFIKENTSR